METVAVFAPLLGAAVAGLFGRKIGDRAANLVTCALMLASAGCAVALFNDILFLHHPRTVELFTWISSGALNVSWALRFDELAAVMVTVVTVVSCCVHFYSIGYMAHDKARARFTSYLSLFTFAMLMLVTADNLVQLFFGWEGVGLMSYLLIGFWNEKESANNAAIKAFVMNRIGDFGLALGLMATFFLFHSLNFDYIFAHAAEMKDATILFLGHGFNALDLICALLFVGAMGKSAQLGLHTWLPDAMEGPTPVSALIHAATMVTAGVFMVARMSPLYEYAVPVRMFITVMGALTAFIAATIAVTQFDIKRVIAYSTMSQLGYMFFALGVSAYSAAIFHLFTHAFFKALLFLGSGSVIHAMGGEQDMRKMGGLWKKIPQTYVLMWVGSLALAGIPLFAGYYSKDMILEADFSKVGDAAHFAYWLGVAAAFLTAFYSWRMIFMTFHGKPRADHHTMEHVHESPFVMLAPLYVLGAGAAFGGWAFHDYFVGEGRHAFWGKSLFVLKGDNTVAMAERIPYWAAHVPVAVGVIGILVAFWLYMKATGLPAKIAAAFRPIYKLLFNKWYFDEIYNAAGVVPAFIIGKVLWKTGDGKIIDGLGPDGVAKAVARSSRETSKLETGYVYHYAFAMLLGVVAFITAYIFLVQS
ncbi:MAG: NADH-quinone oxidoreductase subunit L [Alphaproteobacteria bacterium]|nr:NADH-quinone oxidoreductase subunit L [Alphaproteobacteria bacterium]MDE2335806.1 NADH-quinone oxidoreductase subunit L [Alphaproteobacteria bacterium]